MKRILVVFVTALVGTIAGQQSTHGQTPSPMRMDAPSASETAPMHAPPAGAEKQSGQYSTTGVARANSITAGSVSAAMFQSAGTELGYSVKVGSGEFGTIDASFIKVGKSAESFGLLKQKWDQRETVNLRYVPTETGLKITGAKRVIEQKPPVGEWKVIREDSEVPAELLSKLGTK